MTVSWAPTGTSLDSAEWIDLGYTEDCSMQYLEPDAPIGPLIGFDPDGHCVVSFSVDAFSPYGYWVFFRRKHPRIKAMRAAYRRKTKRR